MHSRVVNERKEVAIKSISESLSTLAQAAGVEVISPKFDRDHDLRSMYHLESIAETLTLIIEKQSAQPEVEAETEAEAEAITEAPKRGRKAKL
jgi:hypothetical protein